MDSIFLADNIAIPEYRVTHLPQTQFDPVVVLSALAAVTSRIGLIGTGSTTYSKPWDLARRFATLDHISGGRAGWNIVTTRTPLVAANFGESSHPEHADRYTRAHEFVDVVQRVWDGWEDDAITGDRSAGCGAIGQVSPAALPRRVLRRRWHLPFPAHPRAGRCSCRPGSPLPASAWPLATPSWLGPPSLAAAIEFRAGLHRQAAAAGRRPISARPPRAHDLPRRDRGRSPGQGRPAGRTGESRLPVAERALLSGHNPDDFDPDAPLPPELYDGVRCRQQRAAPVRAAREHPGLPLRELARQLGGARPRLSSSGTPEQLADHIIASQDAGAVDGFTIMGSTLPYELRAFAEHVVPILQARGRFRTEYSGHTLRDHLGLDRPAGDRTPDCRRRGR